MIVRPPSIIECYPQQEASMGERGGTRTKDECECVCVCVCLRVGATAYLLCLPRVNFGDLVADLCTLSLEIVMVEL